MFAEFKGKQYYANSVKYSIYVYVYNSPIAKKYRTALPLLQ